VAPIVSERLELVSLSPELVDALLAGRRERPRRVDGIEVPAGWPDRGDEGFLLLRRRQMLEDPGVQEWLVRAIVLRAPGRPLVGHIGFHGRPGRNGLRRDDAVEIGYTVFEPFRRRGYATEAVKALLGWAERAHGITRFVASVAPHNEASLAIIRRLGFRPAGSQWDEEDGLEIIHELERPARASALPPASGTG
jgi:ribosomal-protein-alanine N-acetyltransferase